MVDVSEPKKTPEQRYFDACRAMQSGVAMVMSYEPSATSPKHLRVGVCSAMVEHSALALLLISKGVITEDEYKEAIASGMEAEVKRYEKVISEHLGGKEVTLV